MSTLPEKSNPVRDFSPVAKSYLAKAALPAKKEASSTIPSRVHVELTKVSVVLTFVQKLVVKARYFHGKAAWLKVMVISAKRF